MKLLLDFIRCLTFLYDQVGLLKLFYIIKYDVLRKIVNHPDLLERNSRAGDAKYGDPVRSGKLQVALKILSMWKSQGHRCLVFSQTQQMLDILEQVIVNEGYTYRRMDGTTPVAHRMGLVDSFNDDGNVEEGVSAEAFSSRRLMSPGSALDWAAVPLA